MTIDFNYQLIENSYHLLQGMPLQIQYTAWKYGGIITRLCELIDVGIKILDPER